MSRGLGRVQRDCLGAIRLFEQDCTFPTALNLCQIVYDLHWHDIKPEHLAAVRRALSSLQRKGLVEGRRRGEVSPLNELGTLMWFQWRSCAPEGSAEHIAALEHAWITPEAPSLRHLSRSLSARLYDLKWDKFRRAKLKMMRAEASQ
jgi:hypothetical protein